MHGLSRKHAILTAIFGTINIIGLVWIHHDLTRKPRPTTRVLSAALLPDSENPDRIRLTFDRDLAPRNRVDQAEEAALFTLDPARPGQWIWSACNQLSYVLHEPLPAGRVLRVAAGKDLERRTGRTLEGPAEFELATDPLRVKTCLVHAYDESSVTFQVRFNQPVDPGEFLRHAMFSDRENSSRLRDPQCLTRTPQEELFVRFPRPRSDWLRMVIDKNLTGDQGQLGLERPFVVERQIPADFTLLHARAGVPDLEGGGFVTLRFSHELSRKQETPELKIDPHVEEQSAYHHGRNLVVSGKFKAGREYTIEVPNTLVSAKERTLKKDITATVRIPNYRPRIQFAHSQGILSPWGTMMLDAKAVNIADLELRAWRVHANNLVSHLHGSAVDTTSRCTLDRTVQVSVSDDKPADLALDLRELLSQPVGTYRIEARAANRHWTYDRALVAITDLAITAKRQRGGYMIWVTSLRTAEPVAGVTIAGLTYNNQTIATAESDADGTCHLRFSGDGPDGGIWVITARKDDDLSYLLPSENEWVTDDIEQTGRPYANHYEVMLYTDRGVYRPGEKIHLTGIVRDTSGAIPSAFPLSLKVSRPDGRQVADLLVNRHEKDQGLFHVDFPTSDEGQTGPYSFRASLPESRDSLGSTTALVEAFVPVRMEVQVEPSAERFGPNSLPSVKAAARYLWDQPASGLPVKIEGSLRPIRFQSKAYREFEFGEETQDAPISLPGVKGRLDETGQCQMSAKLPEPLKAGLYRVWLSATVTEPGGRSVSSNTSATLDRLNTFIGLRLRAGQVVPVDEVITVDWVRLTGADEPASEGQIAWRLLRVEYDTVLQKVNGRTVWKSVRRTVEVGEDKRIIAGGSEGSLEFVCADSGTYRLVLTDTATGSCTPLQFYASRHRSDSQTMAMNQPERLEIIPGRDEYRPGQTVKILVRSPIAPGTLLLTTETDQVIAHRMERLSENTLELEVPLPVELRGSVFLTGTVVRAIDPNEDNWLPHRAMGTVQIKLDHGSQRLPVRITAPANALPGDTVHVTIQTARPSDPNHCTLVHLWAVDTGILLTGAYQTPDLCQFFLGSRTAGVSTADVFFWLLPDHKRPAGIARIGADTSEYDALRRNPIPTRRRQPAVLWRRAVPVDSSGQVWTQMKLPELTGEMRLMAVAVDHDRYGRADHALTLRAPLLLEASWPRFAAPGDQFTVPVKLFNSTEETLTVQLEALATGPVELSTNDYGDGIVVHPGQPSTTLVRVNATEVGPAEVDIRASANAPVGSELSTHAAHAFSVRPAASLHSEVRLLALPGGEQLTVEPSGTFLHGTARMSISVSARPSVQLGPALEELIRYPYGCAEQTSSRLFSLLYAPRILHPARADEIDAMVKAGIARLWSMQTSSGGLSYWPGGSSACLWATAYAASCLLEAKNAGHSVDPRFVRDLAKFLAGKLKESDGEAADLNTKALICRVLATFDQPPHGWMARLEEQKDKLDIAASAHLAAAFQIAGDTSKAFSLLPERVPQETVPTSTTARLTSQVRQEAVWLSALLEIDPNHLMVTRLAARLDKARSTGQWHSTLNNAAAIAALSRYQAMTGQAPSPFSGAIQTAGGDSTYFDQERPVSLKLDKVTEPIQISSSGPGTAYISIASEGLGRDDLVKPYSHRLTVERRWTDRDGQPVDTNDLAVGDLIQVDIVLRTSEKAVHNIAVVDALPAGMEVENPRLATSDRTGELAGNRPDHVEFLDDRVILFCTARPEKKVFKYALRAITAGEFALPAIQASCMYDPAFACLGKTSQVKISNR